MISSHISMMTWLEEVPEALLLLSPHGEVLHANLKARALLNLNLSVPVVLDDIFDMLASMGNLTRALMRLVPGEEKRLHMRYRKDPARTFNVSMRRSVHHRYIVASMREEEDLLNKFEPLRHELESYQLLARNLPNAAIILFDQDMRYLIAEGSALEAAGFKPENLLGKTLYEALPDSVPHLEPIYKRALAGEAHEAIINASSGRIYESTVIPLKDRHDVVQGGMLFILDISAYHKQFNKLDMQERSLGVYAQQMSVIREIIADPSHPTPDALTAMLDIPELSPQLARHELDIPALIKEIWRELAPPDYIVPFIGKHEHVMPLHGDRHDLKILFSDMLEYVLSTLPESRDAPLTLEIQYEVVLHMLTLTMTHHSSHAVNHALPQTESALLLQLVDADPQVVRLLRLRHLALSCSGTLHTSHTEEGSSIVLTLQLSDAESM